MRVTIPQESQVPFLGEELHNDIEAEGPSLEDLDNNLTTTQLNILIKGEKKYYLSY